MIYLGLKTFITKLATFAYDGCSSRTITQLMIKNWRIALPQSMRNRYYRKGEQKKKFFFRLDTNASVINRDKNSSENYVPCVKITDFYLPSVRAFEKYANSEFHSHLIADIAFN